MKSLRFFIFVILSVVTFPFAASAVFLATQEDISLIILLLVLPSLIFGILAFKQYKNKNNKKQDRKIENFSSSPISKTVESPKSFSNSSPEEVKKPNKSELPLLRGNGNFDVNMTGAQHHTDALQKAFRAKINAAKKEYVDTGIEIDEGDTEEMNITVTLVLEDSNPHDSNAVAVMVRDNLIGYLPRGIAPLYRDYLQRNGLQGQQCHCKAQASIPLHPSGDDWDIALDLPKLK